MRFVEKQVQHKILMGKIIPFLLPLHPKKTLAIAIAVYVENGGWGSTWAAPIASLMIEKYLKRAITNKAQEAFILNGNLIEKE